jgi:hypothetical protein
MKYIFISIALLLTSCATTNVSVNNTSTNVSVNNTSTNIVVEHGMQQIIYKDVTILDEQETFVMFIENGVQRIVKAPYKIKIISK